MTEAPGHPPERFIPGQVLAGRYRVVERIGAGGMGEVYRARDLKLGTTVALKFLPPELSYDRQRLASLFAEVRLARQVSHPNVCRVHDVVEVDGLHFLTMEHVDGEDLGSLLRRIGRLPADKAVEIAREICSGLAAVHDHGLVHRDLKPANVMIDGRGSARITDFGLAEVQGASAPEGTITGTPAYMAPECLLEGKPHTIASDVYGVGAILYELFTGRRPYEAATLKELIQLLREAKPASPSSVQRDVEPAVERLIMHCLDRDPAQRPPSAIAVAAALPGADPLAAAVAAGRTPSPDMVAAATTGAEGLRPAVAWSALAALVLGVALVAAVAPATRLVPALAFEKSPEALAGVAENLLGGLGLGGDAVDRAWGYAYDPSPIDRIVAHDRSPTRWNGLGRNHPEIVTFWYRESPVELQPSDRWDRVSYGDPPGDVTGMAGVELDAAGRLHRLDASPAASAPEPHATRTIDRLFHAAGLDTADYAVVATPSDPDDGRWGFERRSAARGAGPAHINVVVAAGRSAVFSVEEPGVMAPASPGSSPDLSASVAWGAGHVLRPMLALLALILGAWLARRNLRAGRGDTKRALRVAVAMLSLRFAIWLFGAHHSFVGLPDQLAAVLAWGTYDAVYGWVFYVAIEPYVRRFWPRVLTSWVRLLDGRFADARVGRDVLIGCLLGTGIAIAVAAHQAAPAWFGGAPGRPDNVGYVENQLAAMLGLRHQIADLLLLYRSSIVLVMGFVVILVMARILTRSAAVALVLAFVVFVPLALPKGEVLWLNVALAALSTIALLVVLMRAGLVAATVGLLVYTTLEAATFGLGSGPWPSGPALVALLIVLGAGLHGFARALGGRPAIRDVLAEVV